jgi:hypothetical protein
MGVILSRAVVWDDIFVFRDMRRGYLRVICEYQSVARVVLCLVLVCGLRFLEMFEMTRVRV